MKSLHSGKSWVRKFFNNIFIGGIRSYRIIWCLKKYFRKYGYLVFDIIFSFISHKPFSNTCTFYQRFKMPSVHVHMCIFLLWCWAEIGLQSLKTETDRGNLVLFELQKYLGHITKFDLFMSLFIFKNPCLLAKVYLKS